MKTDIRSGGQKQKYIRSLSDLEDSRIVSAVHHCKDLSLGNLTKEETTFKLYPLDIGLMLETLLGEEGLSCEEAYKKIRFGKLTGANLGLLYECAALQALAANGHTIYYHTFQYGEASKRYEIDFVGYLKGRLTAFEIKSTNRFTTSSLDALASKYSQLTIDRVVISPKPLSRANNVLNLPLYLTYLL